MSFVELMLWAGVVPVGMDAIATPHPWKSVTHFPDGVLAELAALVT
jgi:hypothetical protein